VIELAPERSVSLDGLEVNPELGYKVHPFADAFPMMEGAEFDELVEDIRKNGLRVPVEYIKHGGEHIVIDGRNRLRACRVAGVTVKSNDYTHFIRYESAQRGLPRQPPTDEELLDYIWSKNVHRRQLTPSQRAIIATEHQKFINQIHKTSAQRRKATQGRPKKGAKKTGGNVASSLKTADILAKTAKVSPRTMKDALAVKKSGDEELVKQVKSGTKSVSAAAKEVRRKKTPAAKKRPPPILFGKLANDWGKILQRHEKREAEAVRGLVERARFGMGECHRYEIRRAAKMIGLHMQQI
jgi:ParB-like chromosome segregation protein Spo0J